MKNSPHTCTKCPLCSRETARLLLKAAIALSLLTVALVQARLYAQPVQEMLPAWEPGMLDIHEISTGRGSSTFFIFPDGTTMLYDAGEFTETDQEWRIPRYVEARPDESRLPSEWIVRYIDRVLQGLPVPARKIDYAMPSHFHWDHMGQVTDNTPKSEKGNYLLTGITRVGDRFPIRTVLDRGWPDYDYPTSSDDRTLRNYRDFLEWHMENNDMQVERFQPGHNDQIILRHEPKEYPGFEVRNIAANGEVWTGVGSVTRSHFPPLETLERGNYPHENICSLALRLSYGRFDYFTGGDIAGITFAGQPEWYDLETPVAKAVGPVEVSVLNHHGYLDSQNAFFVRTLRPLAWIIPVWDSAHPSPTVYRRLQSEHLYPGPRDIFATAMHDANRLVVVGLDRLASDRGHVVVRVAPGGDSFRIYVLDNADEEMRITSIHGPYKSR